VNHRLQLPTEVVSKDAVVMVTVVLTSSVAESNKTKKQKSFNIARYGILSKLGLHFRKYKNQVL